MIFLLRVRLLLHFFSITARNLFYLFCLKIDNINCNNHHIFHKFPYRISHDKTFDKSFSKIQPLIKTLFGFEKTTRIYCLFFKFVINQHQYKTLQAPFNLEYKKTTNAKYVINV